MLHGHIRVVEDDAFLCAAIFFCVDAFLGDSSDWNNMRADEFMCEIANFHEVIFTHRWFHAHDNVKEENETKGRVLAIKLEFYMQVNGQVCS